MDIIHRVFSSTRSTIKGYGREYIPDGSNYSIIVVGGRSKSYV